jgi:flagellar FliJ protein
VKRFKFSLEKALNLRKYREQEAEIALGRVVGELTVIEQRLKDLALRRRAGEEEFRAGIAGSGAPGSGQTGQADYYRNYAFYIRRLDVMKEELLEAATKAQLKVEEEREHYLEASRQRKVLDKLKEKRAHEYHRAVLAGETKILDDISNGREARELAAESAKAPPGR